MTIWLVRARPCGGAGIGRFARWTLTSCLALVLGAVAFVFLGKFSISPVLWTLSVLFFIITLLVLALLCMRGCGGGHLGDDLGR